MTAVMLVLLGVLVLFAIVLLASVAFTVGQQERAIVTQFGKYARTAGPGLNFKVPIYESVVARVSLQVQQLQVSLETKTHDNVFVKLTCSIQYQVMETKVMEAFYRLSSPVRQIESHVFDVIRAQVPGNDLDDVFATKDTIAKAVRQALDTVMEEYGYRI